MAFKKTTKKKEGMTSGEKKEFQQKGFNKPKGFKSGTKD